MPITLNLLAEDQAAEESRRRDPVKRAIIIGAVLVGALLVWSSSLQVQAIIAKKGFGQIDAQLASHTNQYLHALDWRKKTTETQYKLDVLRQLAANRFLHGTLLNALQQTIVDDIQLTHFKIDQSYSYMEGTKATTNGDRVIPARPATTSEKITLTLNAKDTGANPGDQLTRFKEAIAKHPYFQSALGATNEVRLSNLSAPQTGPDGRMFVMFTLECRFPERIR